MRTMMENLGELNQSVITTKFNATKLMVEFIFWHTGTLRP